MEIDVTKCENYKLGFSGYICVDPNLRNNCSLNNNCKFKQLQRYKQTVEEIKYIINVEVKQNPNYWNDYVNIYYEVLNQIIQKCEEVEKQF